MTGYAIRMPRAFRLRALLVAGAASIVLASSPPASAQQPDVAGAEALFEQGRQLMTAGKVKDACPKFEESHRLAPAAGTALNLANCYEKLGKIASAWGMYKDAISLSIASGQAVREQYAKSRATELEPKLIKLVVQVPNAAPGLEVRRDGIAMTQAQWGTPIPIDPGSHTIEASAPNKKSWTKTFDVSQEGATAKLTIPALEDAPAEHAGAVTPVQPQTHDSGGTLRVIGFTTMAVGAVALGVGGYFAYDSASKKDDLEQAARNGEPWSADRQTTYDDGKSAATLANVFFIAGGAVLVTGAVLTVLGYSKKSETDTAAHAKGPAFAGASVGPRGGSLAWTF